MFILTSSGPPNFLTFNIKFVPGYLILQSLQLSMVFQSPCACLQEKYCYLHSEVCAVKEQILAVQLSCKQISLTTVLHAVMVGFIMA